MTDFENEHNQVRMAIARNHAVTEDLASWFRLKLQTLLILGEIFVRPREYDLIT